jgi:hypothetical protein
MAMLKGIATSNTDGKGRRNIPIATNMATRITSPMTSRRLISGIIILKTTASIKPIAAQATPARIRRYTSISP